MEKIKIVDDLIVQINHVRKTLSDKIKNLPDNPRIKRLEGSCFVIKLSDLQDNWSPQHHDFRFQYQRISDELNNKPPEFIVSFLQQVVDEGRIRESNGQYFTFHNDVREAVRNCLSP